MIESRDIVRKEVVPGEWLQNGTRNKTFVYVVFTYLSMEEMDEDIWKLMGTIHDRNMAGQFVDVLRTNKFGTIRSVHLIKFTFDIRPIERNC
jgi:hypothetical protein